MEKKKIDIQENIIDTENFLPDEKSDSGKITYRASGYVKSSRNEKAEAEPAAQAEEDFFDKKRLDKKHKRRIGVGFVMCVLMLIGIGTIVSGSVKIAAKIFDNTAEKKHTMQCWQHW